MTSFGYYAANDVTITKVRYHYVALSLSCVTWSRYLSQNSVAITIPHNRLARIAFNFTILKIDQSVSL